MHPDDRVSLTVMDDADRGTPHSKGGIESGAVRSGVSDSLYFRLREGQGKSSAAPAVLCPL